MKEQYKTIDLKIKQWRNNIFSLLQNMQMLENSWLYYIIHIASLK